MAPIGSYSKKYYCVVTAFRAILLSNTIRIIQGRRDAKISPETFNARFGLSRQKRLITLPKERGAEAPLVSWLTQT